MEASAKPFWAKSSKFLRRLSQSSSAIGNVTVVGDLRSLQSEGSRSCFSKRRPIIERRNPTPIKRMKTNTTCPKGQLTLLTSLSAALLLSTQGIGSAASFVYTGGDLEGAANWQNTGDLTTGNRPGAGDVGIISTSGTVGNGFGTSNTISGFDGTVANPTVINHTAGTMAGSYNWTSPDSIYNLQGGTIESSFNFNSNGPNSAFNLSSGSLVMTNTSASDIIVNGAGASINMSGSATIEVPADFDLRLNNASSFFTIDPGWTGSFIAGSENTEADWVNELVWGSIINGAGTSGTLPARLITIGGTQVTDVNFSSLFTVTALGGGGSSLSLTNPVPEPSVALLGGLGLLGLLRRRRD